MTTAVWRCEPRSRGIQNKRERERKVEFSDFAHVSHALRRLEVAVGDIAVSAILFTRFLAFWRIYRPRFSLSRFSLYEMGDSERELLIVRLASVGDADNTSGVGATTRAPPALRVWRTSLASLRTSKRPSLSMSEHACATTAFVAVAVKDAELCRDEKELLVGCDKMFGCVETRRRSCAPRAAVCLSLTALARPFPRLCVSVGRWVHRVAAVPWTTRGEARGGSRQLVGGLKSHHLFQARNGNRNPPFERVAGTHGRHP